MARADVTVDWGRGWRGPAVKTGSVIRPGHGRIGRGMGQPQATRAGGFIGRFDQAAFEKVIDGRRLLGRVGATVPGGGLRAPDPPGRGYCLRRVRRWPPSRTSPGNAP